MITHNDQMNLLKLISNNLSNDASCYAFGGTAMMFYGFKDETKDIDLVFETKKERDGFISAIKDLGFEETSPFQVYTEGKLQDKNKPLMYSRDDFRIDIFLQTIFQTKLSESMKENFFAVHDFLGKKRLTLKVLKTEHIVQLKAVTDRNKDFEDILTIVQRDRNFDWQYLVDEAIWQHKEGDTWMLLDIEKMMKRLQEYVPVQEKYFRQLYEAQK